MTLATKATVKKGTARVKIACPATAKGSCKGTLTLKAGKLTVGSSTFSVPAGAKGKVSVKLTKTLAKGKVMKAKGYAVATDDVSLASTSKGKIKLKFKS